MSKIGKTNFHLFKVGEHPRATGEIFNCCGPKATTGKEFAALVEEIIPTANVKFGYPWGVAQGIIRGRKKG